MTIKGPTVTDAIELPPEGCCVLDEMSDEIGFSAATIASHTGIDEARVREWQRAFKVLGLAEFGFLRDLDGEGLRGRGYWLNDKGCKLRHRLNTRTATNRASEGDGVVKHMANRFLMWRLPENFHPDAGIGFTPSFPNEPMRSRHWPVGTNLFDAEQAEQMVRHMLESVPLAVPTAKPDPEATRTELVGEMLRLRDALGVADRRGISKYVSVDRDDLRALLSRKQAGGAPNA